jgi:hypothetical protein
MSVTGGTDDQKEKEPDIVRMKARIGQLTLENDFSGNLRKPQIKAGILIHWTFYSTRESIRMAADSL